MTCDMIQTNVDQSPLPYFYFCNKLMNDYLHIKVGDNRYKHIIKKKNRFKNLNKHLLIFKKIYVTND